MKKAGWKIVSGKQLIPKYKLTDASLNPLITPRTHATRLACVLQTFPRTILEKCKEIWEAECPAFRGDSLAPSIKEFLHHIAMRTYMSIHPQTKITDHWKNCHPLFSTKRDFTIINKNLPLDVDHAIHEQNKALRHTFISGSARMADETMIIKTGKQSRVTKIARKPHPLGHEIKNEGQLLAGKPILTRYMYKKEGKRTTVDQIVSKLLKYKNAEQNHFVGDSWFNSASSRAWMEENDIEYTVTSNSMHDTKLWEWLGGGDTGIPLGTIKHAYNTKTGEVAMIANTSRYSRYRSTYFNCLDNPDPNASSDPIRPIYNHLSRIIDEFNTFFYRRRYPHRHRTSASAFFDAIWRIACVNGYAIHYYLHHNREQWEDFLKELAAEMLEEYH